MLLALGTTLPRGHGVRPYTYVTEHGQLDAIAQEILQADSVALDLETACIGGGGSTDPLTGRIRLCSLNTGKNRYVIDAYRTDGLWPIAEALNATNAVIVGQNLKFDQKWLLWHYDVEFKRVFDCYRASNILYAGLPNVGHDLWSLYKRELGEKPVVEDLAASDWDAPELTQQQLDYAADDVDKLLRLREVLKPKLVQAKLVKIAQLEFQAILPEASIELNGFYLDPDMWLKRAAQDDARRRALEAVLLDALPNPNPVPEPPPEEPPADQGTLTGVEPPKKKGRAKKVKPQEPFNLNSPAQVVKSFQMLGITQKWTDPDTRQTSVVPIRETKEIVLAMEADNWPILEKFIEFRGYAQACKSFGPDYLENLHPVTKRIHCSYYPYTDAGRYACSKPNLQQIPRGKAFRECFRAEKGRKLAICDWSNIEMRLVAEISDDQTLIKVFRDDRDAHYATAALLSGKEEKDITKPERQQAKPVNFGFIYGMQAAKLVLYAKAGYGVSLSEGQARKFRKKFFEAYAGIASWHNTSLDSGKRIGETRTLWGRRRLIRDDRAHNEFFNSPVQGSGADGLKNSLRVVYDKLRALNGDKPPLLAKGARVGMIHMVHDEIIVEHADEGEEFAQRVQDALHSGMIEGMAPMMKKVPTAAEVGGGDDWSAK